MDIAKIGKTASAMLGIMMLLCGLFSCENLDREEQEMEKLNKFLQEKNITTEPTESGLYYIEHKEGDGQAPEVGDKVSVHYTAYRLNGYVFDTSEGGDPYDYTHGVGQVIEGMDEGIGYMKEGGEATLIIPSKLAYGRIGTLTIPGYATLIYDIELEDVTR